jgi:hypothetical protein
LRGPFSFLAQIRGEVAESAAHMRVWFNPLRLIVNRVLMVAHASPLRQVAPGAPLGGPRGDVRSPAELGSRLWADLIHSSGLCRDTRRPASKCNLEARFGGALLL